MVKADDDRLFRQEIHEEPQNVSHEAGQNTRCLSTHQCGSCAGISATFGKPELEQLLTQMTFTRSEAQHFISLLHSRTIEEESSSPVISLEASTTSGSIKRHKHGDESHNFHAFVVNSRVLEEELASPVELASRQDSKLINNNATCLSITSVSSPQQPATMENLPEELLSNIFIRLLAKQLAQMRSVNKSWNALLSHPSFVKSHLRHSIHTNRILMVFHDEEDSKPFTAKQFGSPCLELTNFIKLPVNPQFECINGIKIIGSVNGLICSCYGDSIIHIWNPSLSAVLTLPPYSMPSDDCDAILINFRFGYDPKTDDYKVVKLTGLQRPRPSEDAVEWWLQVEIYSMRKGCWELINGRFPSHIARITNGDYGCVDGHDGHLHWLGENKDSESRIVAYDLGSETFREMPLRDSALEHKCIDLLGIFAEKLCVMSYTFENDAFEVWVMDEYGVAKSWVKRHVLSRFSYNTCFYGFTSHNEFLIEDLGNLILYDPSTNEQKIIKDYCPEEFRTDKIVEYFDSLVWVVPGEHETVCGGGQI